MTNRKNIKNLTDSDIERMSSEELLNLNKELDTRLRRSSKRPIKSKPTRPTRPKPLPSPSNDRIVGGTPVHPPHNYPFIVSFQSSGYEHFCGGSLIDPEWVLTAAHCVDDADALNNQVVLGAHLLSDLTEASVRIKWIAEIIMHPDYNKDQLVWDYALVKLASPVILSDGIQPISLTEDYMDGYEDGFLMTIAGWGDYIPDIVSDELLEAQVEIVTDCALTDIWGTLCGNECDYIQMCAGTLDDHIATDACPGDSGGPLFVNVGGVYELFGITSWGYSCWDTPEDKWDFPAAYARINPEIKAWIEDIVTELTCEDQGSLEDCRGNCVPVDWLGDGLCDDGTDNGYDPLTNGDFADFNCVAYNWDNGDCEPDPPFCSDGFLCSDGECILASDEDDGSCDCVDCEDEWLHNYQSCTNPGDCCSCSFNERCTDDDGNTLICDDGGTDIGIGEGCGTGICTGIYRTYGSCVGNEAWSACTIGGEDYNCTQVTNPQCHSCGWPCQVEQIIHSCNTFNESSCESNHSSIDPFGAPLSQTCDWVATDEVVDCAGVCGGLSIVDCEGVCNGGLEIDECNVCDGDNSSCSDECGVLYGDNSSCSDECGIPNGDNSTCSDCNDVPNGDSYEYTCSASDCPPGEIFCSPNYFDNCLNPGEQWGQTWSTCDCDGNPWGGGTYMEFCDCFGNIWLNTALTNCGTHGQGGFSGCGTMVCPPGKCNTGPPHCECHDCGYDISN